MNILNDFYKHALNFRIVVSIEGEIELEKVLFRLPKVGDFCKLTVVSKRSVASAK